MAKVKQSLTTIAVALGVSKATVSWVLSGQGDSKGISPATQKKVKDYAEAHNYRPNMLARSLSMGVSKSVGLLISSLSDPFYTGIAKAVLSAAESKGYSVIIGASESDFEKEDELVTTFSYRRVDGIIITPTGSRGWEDSFRVQGGKAVFIDRGLPDCDYPSVCVDNAQSSCTLVRHLIGKGCRKIAIMITAHNLSNMQARHDGYLEALSEAGIESDAGLVCEVPPAATIPEINSALDRLFEKVPDVDGIFFTSHVLVLPTYVHLAMRGFKIDGGARWACFHTQPEFGLLLPEMSIALMPLDKLGSAAMETLLSQMDEKAEGMQSAILNCEMLLH